MRYQIFNDRIYAIRQEILEAIYQAVVKQTNSPSGHIRCEEFSGVYPTILTFETDDHVANVELVEIKANCLDNGEHEVEIFLKEDELETYSTTGDNLYVEGLNDILDAIEEINLLNPKQ